MSRDPAWWPPGRGTVSVPRGSRREAAAGLVLAGPSKRGPRLGTMVAWLAARTIGPIVLHPWSRAADEEEALALLDDLRAQIGPFDAVATYRPRQVERRHRALLLVRRGRPTAFVKVREENAAIAAEQKALQIVGGRRIAGVQVPSLLGCGTAGGSWWLATTPLAPRPHRPIVDRDVTTLAAAVTEHLADLPRPQHAPDTWAPCHGDLTPWNHRRVLGDGSWLFDWERARWAPRNADLVLAAAARRALGRACIAPAEGAEAVSWWLSDPELTGSRDPLAQRMVLALRAMHPAV